MDFQTPMNICEYMVSMLPLGVKTVLEPTAGMGNLVRALEAGNYEIDAPIDFFSSTLRKYDAVVMNPPFSPMLHGYKILYECMEISGLIIAIMPWLTIINSEKRTKDIMEYGLKSLVHLPRSTFKGARVQTCIMEMSKGYRGITEWKAL